jgi:uncharacterized repeat protein (TIGR01451 family)
MTFRILARRSAVAAVFTSVLAGAPWLIAADAAEPVGAPIAAPELSGEIDVSAVAELTAADGRMHVFVELEGMPAARAWAARLDDFSARTPAALAAAAAESRRQVAANQSAQAALESQLFSGDIQAQEVYRLAKVANGFVVRVEPAKLAELRQLPGVRAVRLVDPEEPQNSTSVPFVDAPPAWGDALGLGTNLTGTGVKIGVIDTGIDYQHTNFGGTGLLADYSANDRTVAPDAFFPTAKVVGGVDLAGDTYNASGNGGTTGSTTPVPDADPMDCNRHGSHVAGTAAGYGVNGDGTTFAGPWDGATPFAGMRIGPGVAPQASLYAIRVFGCQGSTSLTALGIDWAVDPNNDSDLSDHLDVINMSLGSNFGSVNDLTAQASDSAALAGVIVVASAGNAGDTFFITGSPGAAGRALSVAASQDSGQAGAFLTVNSPPSIAGAYAAAASAYTDPTPPPPPAASGQTGSVVLMVDATAPINDGCQAPTNGAAIAGNIALVDRGTCNFNVKVQFAQTSGAIGVIVGNNAAGDPVPNVMGGAATIEMTIPGVSVSKATRDAIVAALGSGPVNVTMNGGNAGDVIATFSSRGPRRASSPIKLKPEITAPGFNITSTQTGASFAGGSCSPNCAVSLANAGLNSSLTISGTSMAAPHMAGVLALMRQEHPSWTVEELKALVMNYANHDTFLGANSSGARFAPSRIGGGRVDVAKAAQGQVIAMSKDAPGLVAVSFGTEVVSNLVLSRTVRVVNHGTSDQTFDLALDAVLDAPGVAISLPAGSTVTVPAGSSVEIPVQLTATSSTMDNHLDPTMATGQAVTAPAGLAGLGALARQQPTEETGYITFSQGGNLKLRVPYYSMPRPASQMAGGPIVTGGAATGSTTIPLTGVDVCTGTLGAGPTCSGTFPTDEVSLVTPFELQLMSPRNPSLALVDSFGDIQNVGVAADAAGTNIFFGISSWANWSSGNDTVYNIWIDNNEDGTWDRVVFNGSVGQVSSRLFGSANDNAQDNDLSFLFTPPGTVGSQFFINTSPAAIDTELLNSGVQVLAVQASAIGLNAGNNNFRYRVESCRWSVPLCSALPAFVSGSGLDNTGAGFATWDRTARGVDFGGSILFFDLNGGTVPVSWNTANMTANASLGALLLHHFNTEGNQAQVVLLDTAQSADLSISKSMSPPTPVFGQNATFTVTVTNNGPNTASGVSVLDALPAGLTYVSDNGVGAYVPATGVWTVPGSLANGASASLQIVATVDTTDTVYNTAVISAASPLDPDPSDNSSTVTVNAAEVADIQLAMSAGSPTVLVGGSFTVNLTATNNGGDTGFSVAVNELFTGFEPLAPTANLPSDGVYTPATGLWSVASLGDGGSASLALTFTAPNMAGALTNNGTASSAVADSNNANNTASASITVLSPATVTATKTVSGGFYPGGTVTYTVVLSNSAAYDQQNNPGNEFSDVLPPSLTLVSAVATSGTAGTAGNTATWNGVVPAAGSVTVTITATINVGTALTTISNQGATSYDADGNGVNEASGLTDDPGVGGAADPTAFLVTSPAIVNVTKTVGAGPYTPGGGVTYTVVLSNTGNGAQLDNAGHELTDVLPTDLTLVSASASSGSAVATVGTNTVTWDGTIPPAGSVTVTINATVGAAVPGGQTVTNQGTTAFDADGNGANESGSLTDDPTVGGILDPTSFVVGSPATLSATKAVSVGPYVPGAAVTYTVVISNTAATPQSDNPGHELIDVLPAELTLLSASATSGTAVATVATNTVTWDGAVPAGGSVTITITATISGGGLGQTVSNQATVNFDADGNGTNESSAVTDDPSVGGAGDATQFAIAGLVEVPALSPGGLGALLATLALAGMVVLRRRRTI